MMKSPSNDHVWKTIYESELKWLRKAVDNPTCTPDIRVILEKHIKAIERKLKNGEKSFGIG